RGTATVDLCVRDLRTNEEAVVAAGIASPETSSRATDSTAITFDADVCEVLKGTPLAWSPDGRSVAFSRRQGEGWRLEVAGVAPGRRAPAARRMLAAALARAGGPQHHPAWSPDGRSLAYLSGGSGTDLYVADGRTGSVRCLTTGAAH